MDSKVNKVIRLWTTRNTRLEQSKQVIKFEGEVPKVVTHFMYVCLFIYSNSLDIEMVG